jgi:hypothetical protein
MTCPQFVLCMRVVQRMHKRAVRGELLMCLHAHKHEAFTRRDQLSDYVDEKFPGSGESLRSAVPFRYSVVHKGAPKTTSYCSYVVHWLLSDVYVIYTIHEV